MLDGTYPFKCLKQNEKGRIEVDYRRMLSRQENRLYRFKDQARYEALTDDAKVRHMIRRNFMKPKPLNFCIPIRIC